MRPLKWNHRIDLSDVFHSESMTFFDRRDAIVARIRATSWAKRALAGLDGYELDDILLDLADSVDVEEFDDAWANFYDWADAERVWVETVCAR